MNAPSASRSPSRAATRRLRELVHRWATTTGEPIAAGIGLLHHGLWRRTDRDLGPPRRRVTGGGLGGPRRAPGPVPGVSRPTPPRPTPLHRGVRLRAAEPVPADLTAGVLAAIGDDRRRLAGRQPAPRARGDRRHPDPVAMPALLFGDDAGLPAHTARHLGSFAVALGIGFLVAAWQPRRVGGLLSLTAALVACLLVSSAIDVRRAATRARRRSWLGTPPRSWVSGCCGCWRATPGQVGSLVGAVLRSAGSRPLVTAPASLRRAVVLAALADRRGRRDRGPGVRARVARVDRPAGRRGARHRTPPRSSSQFTEPVTVALGGVRVFDARGERVATDRAEQAVAAAWCASGCGAARRRVLRRDLAGAPPPTPTRSRARSRSRSARPPTPPSRESSALSRPAARRPGRVPRVWAWPGGSPRWLAFSGIALLVGGVFFGVVVWTRARDLRATRRIVTGSWVVLTVATVVGFVLQGPYAAGLRLRRRVRSGALGRRRRHPVRARVARPARAARGRVRLAALVVRSPARGRAPAAAVVAGPRGAWWGSGIVASPALAGHSAAGDYRLLAALTSTIHVGAMAIWLGGLVMMGAVVVRGPDIDGQRGRGARGSRGSRCGACSR